MVYLRYSANIAMRYSIALWSRANQAYIETIATDEQTGDMVPDKFPITTPLGKLSNCMLVMSAWVGKKTAGSDQVWVDLVTSQNERDVDEYEHTERDMEEGDVVSLTMKLNLSVT